MPKKSRKNVGLIGLGIIGSRVANTLRMAGFHVYVWNRTPRAAPNFLASPRQVAELCDVIQVFVADAQALFDVLEAMGDAIKAGHIIICNSTVGPEATLEAARIVTGRGAQFLDAPFAGSKPAAQNGELVYYIGGDDKTLEAVEPVLKASSKAIVKIGKIGDAAVVKVATNMITAVTVQTLAEAYAIVKASEIDPEALSEALKHHGIRSGVADAKLAKILERDYDPHFSLKHMFKDVQLGIHIANSLEIDLPATTATAGVMYGGLTKGWADEDFSVLGRCYQKEDQNPTLPGPASKEQESQIPVRELTADELRNVGVKVPGGPASQPADLKPPASGAKSEPPKAGAVPAKADAAPPKADTVPPKKEPEPVAASSGASTSPGEPEQPHPHFVRIRRWFGTGSAS